MINDLSYFITFGLSRIRGHPLFREGTAFERRDVQNIVIFYFDVVSHDWQPLSIHRTSEKYFKVIDYQLDTVRVFSSAKGVLRHISKKYYQ